MRIAKTASLLAALALLAAGCSSDIQREKAQDDLTEASHQLQDGQIAAANMWTDRALKASPNDEELYFGPPPNSNPDEDELTVLGIYGDMESGADDDPDYVHYTQQGSAKFPNDPIGYYAQIDPLLRLGKPAEARVAAAKAAAILDGGMNKPGANLDPDVMTMLAESYVAAGNLSKGVQDYQSTITAYPSSPAAYNGLAYTWADQNVQSQLPQALVYANQALAKERNQSQTFDDEDIAEVDDTIGWVLFRQGKYDQALDHMLAAVNGAPRMPELRYHLAMDYLAMDNAMATRLGIDKTAAARATLKQLLQVDPTYVDAKTAYDKLPPAPADDDFADLSHYTTVGTDQGS